MRNKDMKELSNLLGFRESIKVVDATLRDGGLVNDFYFTDDFVKALYQANIDAGVDYMEMGYRASKRYLMNRSSVNGNSVVMTISVRSLEKTTQT